MKTNVINAIREEIFPIDEVTENCHASTVLPLEDGSVVAAWFGGTKEGNDDVKIYVSVRENGEWSKPYAVHVDGDVSAFAREVLDGHGVVSSLVAVDVAPLQVVLRVAAEPSCQHAA